MAIGNYKMINVIIYYHNVIKVRGCCDVEQWKSANKHNYLYNKFTLSHYRSQYFDIFIIF
jgi:hypothetical protein